MSALSEFLAKTANVELHNQSDDILDDLILLKQEYEEELDVQGS